MIMVRNCTNLEELWGYVKGLNRKHFPDNKFAPILGNGKTNKPKIMFVFINPTARNISSDKSWRGPRFPFIGTKQIWKVFYRAGLFNKELIDKINTSSDWSVEFTNQVLRFLRNKQIYLTNIVKWTGHDAALPNSEKIRMFLPVLRKEIEIVKPRYIVAFGLIPFESLTKSKIRLSGYYERATKSKTLTTYHIRVGDFKARVIPCYFPIGRGNPERAIELLKLVKKL